MRTKQKQISAPDAGCLRGKAVPGSLRHNKREFQQYFPRAMGMVGKAMRRRMDHNLTQAGFALSAEHLIVLANLHHHNGLTQQEIAELVNRHKASTTRLIDFLEHRALVRRVTGMSDRRQKTIYLTAGGKRLLQKLKVVAATTQREALAGINRDQLQMCKDVLWQVWLNLLEIPNGNERSSG